MVKQYQNLPQPEDDQPNDDFAEDDEDPSDVEEESEEEQEEVIVKKPRGRPPLASPPKVIKEKAPDSYFIEKELERIDARVSQALTLLPRMDNMQGWLRYFIKRDKELQQQFKDMDEAVTQLQELVQRLMKK